MNIKKNTKEKNLRIIYTYSVLFLFAIFFINIDSIAQSKTWVVPKEANNVKNPFAGNIEVLKPAKVIYTSYCAPCHGNKGKGDGLAAAALTTKPADHSSENVQKQTDGALFWMITQGRSPMPSYKTAFTDNQRWQLVNYIRTLAKASAPVKKVTSIQPQLKSKIVISKKNSTKTEIAKTNTPNTDTIKSEVSKTDISKDDKAKTDNNMINPIKEDSTKTASMGSNAVTNSMIQKSVVDSSLLERMDALEKQVNSKKSGEEHFMMVGLVTFGFVNNKTTSTFNGLKHVTKTTSLADPDHYEFSPMFLWRHGKRFLMEFEPSFAGDQLGVNWADISYFVAPSLILRAGYLVIPFGFYSKHLAAGWITKLASDPFGVTDIPPTTDYGVEAEGGIQAGNMKWNYDVSVTNGLQLLGDGSVQNSGITDNNKNKTLTARIGWLPFSNSSLELGVSGLTGKVGDAGSEFEKVNANMYALDLNMVENIQPFQLNIKGQYNFINIGRANYINPGDSSIYSFENRTSTGFIQASLRPSFSTNSVFKNFELAGRYGNFTSARNSLTGIKQNGWAVGLDYWLSWRTVVKFTYEAIKTINNSVINPDTPPGFVNQSNSMYLQFAIQL